MSTATAAGYTGVTASGAGYTGVASAPGPVNDYDATVSDAGVIGTAVTDSPAVARNTVPTAPPDEEKVSRYAYEWPIGPTSAVVTPEKAMDVMRDSPNVVFPFGVRGAEGERTIQRGHVYYLENVRVPGDNDNPVRITELTPTSFTFETMEGHFRGPGRTITFRTREQDGTLMLRQEGVSAATVLDELYDAGARISWRYQADNLRAAIFGGERSDFPGTW